MHLTKALAANLMEHTRGPSHPDWLNRHGTITNLSAHVATIKWDDRRTIDFWPPEALEEDA